MSAAAVAAAVSTTMTCSGKLITCELSILAGFLILLLPFVLHHAYKEITSPNLDNIEFSAETISTGGIEDECPNSADIKSESGEN